ncbi:hypothetical protein ACWD5F_09795 [Streptomyces sp. NPDC002499]
MDQSNMDTGSTGFVAGLAAVVGAAIAVVAYISIRAQLPSGWGQSGKSRLSSSMTLLSRLFDVVFPLLRDLQVSKLRNHRETRVGLKLRLISVVLPSGERERYIEQWMDERNAIRRGEFPKKRFHGLRLLSGAVIQSYESRVDARRSVD